MADWYRSVQPGDRYADCDPRAQGRVVEIVCVMYGGRFVKVRVVADREGALRSSIGKETSINVARLRPTSNGYRLLEESK